MLRKKHLIFLAIFAIIQKNRSENHFFSDCLQKNVDKKRQFAYNKVNCEHFGDFSQKNLTLLHFLCIINASVAVNAKKTRHRTFN